MPQPPLLLFIFSSHLSPSARVERRTRLTLSFFLFQLCCYRESFSGFVFSALVRFGFFAACCAHSAGAFSLTGRPLGPLIETPSRACTLGAVSEFFSFSRVGRPMGIPAPPPPLLPSPPSIAASAIKLFFLPRFFRLPPGSM